MMKDVKVLTEEKIADGAEEKKRVKCSSSGSDYVRIRLITCPTNVVFHLVPHHDINYTHES